MMPMEPNHLREGALGLLLATKRLVGTASIYRRGKAAIALLRPMCEEIIWSDYLVTLPAEDASRLLLCMARTGLYDTYLAQKSYAQAVQMGDLGFSTESEQ